MVWLPFIHSQSWVLYDIALPTLIVAQNRLQVPQWFPTIDPGTQTFSVHTPMCAPRQNPALWNPITDSYGGSPCTSSNSPCTSSNSKWDIFQASLMCSVKSENFGRISKGYPRPWELWRQNNADFLVDFRPSHAGFCENKEPSFSFIFRIQMARFFLGQLPFFQTHPRYINISNSVEYILW